MHMQGKVKVDVMTKNLVKRLGHGDIAVIYHQDIDEVAAQLLIEKKIKAVVNGDRSISGTYPNRGPFLLTCAGITIIDHIGRENFDKVKEMDLLVYDDGKVFINGQFLCPGEILRKKDIEDALFMADKNIEQLLENFIDNTLQYAQKEKNIVLKKYPIPNTKVNMMNKHVLVVARGRNFKEDLRAIGSYIQENRPVIIGVDGGADALLEHGFCPDIIIGDMDSISDDGLRKGKEIIVHAYQDGRCPGLKRVQDLGLKAEKFIFPGTSEDIAMVLAYESNASLIVAVGTHNSMLDFLEKGRKGMASTLLIRMKIGNILVDARGVGQLYRNRVKPSYLVGLFISALFPFAIIIRNSPAIRYLYELISIKLKFFPGKI